MTTRADKITAARVRELLLYDPLTGIFRWRVDRRAGARAGDVAGVAAASGKGYVTITIDNITVRAHRLVWLYVTGHWPTLNIDHKNGIRSDNRLVNLREATCSANNENQRWARRDNVCGLLGVSPKRAGFRAQIKVRGKNVYLGTYKTPEAAHEAYLSAKREYHEGCTI